MAKFKIGDKIRVADSDLVVHHLIIRGYGFHIYDVAIFFGLQCVDSCRYMKIAEVDASYELVESAPATLKPQVNTFKVGDIVSTPNGIGTVFEIPKSSPDYAFVTHSERNLCDLYHTSTIELVSKFEDNHPQVAGNTCTCQSQDLFNLGCKCGYLKTPFKPC